MIKVRKRAHKPDREKTRCFIYTNLRASTSDIVRRCSVSQSSVMKLLKSATLNLPYYQKLLFSTFCELLIEHRDSNILLTDESLFTRVEIYEH